MTPEELQNIIDQGETTNIEFKKCDHELTASVFETICSFLNRDGGILILGVADNKAITGVKDGSIEKMIKNLANTLNNYELFYPTVYLSPEIIPIDDKKVICIDVPESSQVHRYKHKVYDRVGDSDNDITRNFYLVDNLHLKKRKGSSENDVYPYLTMDDLDVNTFKKVRSHIAIFNSTHPWLEMTDEEILKSSGFWRRDPLTNCEGLVLAAALLFGKESTVLSCCPAHRTDAIYRNTSYQRYLHPLPTDPDIRYDDRDMVCDNLINSYTRLMNFVQRNLPDRFRLDEQSINRIDVRNLIFREVVANLLVHREYKSAFPAKLLIFSDRVITENWTKPMQTGNITIENLESHTKNPLITKVFREMKWVEELGSGKKNILKYAPFYYDKYRIEIESGEKFVFDITYRDVIEDISNSGGKSNIESNIESNKVGTIDNNLNDKDKKKDFTGRGVNTDFDGTIDNGTTDNTIDNKDIKKDISINTVDIGIGGTIDLRKAVLQYCLVEQSREEIFKRIGLSNQNKTFKIYLQPLIDAGYLQMTIPDKPTSRNQKYVTTPKGILAVSKKS